jgi:hypothetical protein
MALIPLFVIAQTMDDSAIQDLQNGEYKLAEGKLQVSFEQGVSEEEMRAEVTRLGYEVESAVFENYVLHVDNRIEEDQLTEIEGLTVVDSVLDHRRQYDANLQNKIKESRMMSDAERNELLEQLEKQQGPSGLLLVFLNAGATESTVKEIRSQFENLEISVFKPAQRTAIIKTEVGKELEAMDELNTHSFVENSAFVGVID